MSEQKTTKQIMQDRFDELTAARTKILAASAPLREKRDDIKNSTRKTVLELDTQIKEIEKSLPEIDTDLGRLARALGGRSMSTSNAVR